jgi:hypothetical protein
MADFSFCNTSDGLVMPIFHPRQYQFESRECSIAGMMIPFACKPDAMAELALSIGSAALAPPFQRTEAFRLITFISSLSDKKQR